MQRILIPALFGLNGLLLWQVHDLQGTVRAALADRGRALEVLIEERRYHRDLAARCGIAYRLPPNRYEPHFPAPPDDHTPLPKAPDRPYYRREGE